MISEVKAALYLKFVDILVLIFQFVIHLVAICGILNFKLIFLAFL